MCAFEPCELAKPPEAASWRTMPSSELLRSFHVEPASSGDVGRPHECVRAPRRSGDQFVKTQPQPSGADHLNPSS